MKPQNYMIGTGYHSRGGPSGAAAAWFYEQLWEPNTLRCALGQTFYVMSTGDGQFPEPKSLSAMWIPIYGDLGHCGALLSGEKPYHFGGWTVALLTLALIAYQNECDFIYKEQDVLAFGPWVQTMYSEIGTHGCIFGKLRMMPAANSLMLVRHAFIPEFVRLYLGTGTERNPENLGEQKFIRLLQSYPDQFCQFSFGVDRDRPFDVKAPVWYGQKFTPQELLEIRDAGLIQFESLPEGVSKFTTW